jgi:hypothetical protein
MKSTKDYSIFKEFSSNREIDPKYVNKLKSAIEKKNLLHVNPIIIDDQMRVIDGQHRLAAAAALKVEIFYVEGCVDRRDISILNSNQKNWKAIDYINFYCIEKNESFVKLSRLMNKYPEMSLSAMLTLSNGEGRRSLIELKEGHIDVQNIYQCTQVCDFCKYLHQQYEYHFVFDSKFPLAINKCLNTDNFNLEILEEKIAASPRSLVQCHTTKQYLQMIEEIYNRSMSKNRIRLT